MALDMAPDRNAIRKDLTTLLVKEKRMPEAIALWEDAIRRNANDAEAHDELGLMLATNRDYAAAAKSFTAALGLQPGDNTIRAHLARAHLERGKYELAEAEAQHALEADPKRADARFILGQALSRQGKPA